jgi:5-methylcytosine-specific restriction protein A
VAATTVDHIRPHRGDYDLMWDESNWQSLCTWHHNVKTAKEDGAFGNQKIK